MRLHYLQHVPFEGLANIEAWARARSYHITHTRLFAGEALPAMDAFDWLVIMGGPMNIYEEDHYPWLTAEKHFIAKAIDQGKLVLGICLGAQLIADVLGGPVTRNQEKEIGWFPVSITPQARQSAIFANFPQTFLAFHWHGDTFAIPPGAVHTVQSAACAHQAFTYHDHVVGVQFHLESSEESIAKLVTHGCDELISERYIQQPEHLMQQPEKITHITRNMILLLENLSGQYRS